MHKYENKKAVVIGGTIGMGLATVKMTNIRKTKERKI